jgi:hypothetical protein
METARAILDLRLELDRESISGEVSSDGGPAHRFSGYAGLIAALESIRAGHADSSDPDASEAGSAEPARP